MQIGKMLHTFTQCKFMGTISEYIIVTIFSSAVFRENLRYTIAITLCRHCRHRGKILTFCNISVITEDIYLKLGVCVH